MYRFVGLKEGSLGAQCVLQDVQRVTLFLSMKPQVGGERGVVL